MIRHLSMKKTILALGSLLPPEMKEVEKNFNLLRLWKEADPEAALQNHKNDVVAIISIAGGMQVTRRMIEGLPNLELISQFGVGVDNIDLEAARGQNIAVTNTPDIVTNDTADIALSLLLATMRRVVEADVTVRTGGWRPFPLGTTLTEKTVGIVGLGRIGKAIARRCEAFDMKVIYHGRHEQKVGYAFYADLHQMASAADVLVVATPGGDETHHMINHKILKALGPQSFLVNIARGSVVKTEDLLVSLSNKEIAGAGLDVYEHEPEVPEALKSMDNVVLLPHIGTATQETRTKMGRLVLDNILAHFEGRALLTPLRL